MDPVFNDTSTYQRTVIPQEQVHTQERDGWSRIAQDGQGLGSGVRLDQGSFQGEQPMEDSMMNGMPALAAQFYPSTAAGADQQVGNMNMNMNTNSNFAFAASSHSHAPPVVPSSQGYGPASDIDNAGRTAPSLKPDHIDDGNENTRLGAAGVNYQTLLDNLSQSSASATTIAVPNPHARLSFKAPRTSLFTPVYNPHRMLRAWTSPPALLSKTPPSLQTTPPATRTPITKPLAPQTLFPLPPMQPNPVTMTIPIPNLCQSPLEPSLVLETFHPHPWRASNDRAPRRPEIPRALKRVLPHPREAALKSSQFV